MIVQSRPCLVVDFKGEICAETRDWHIVDHMSHRSVFRMREMGDKLATKEIVINPSNWINSALLALQNLPVELPRLAKIVGRHSVMERFIYDFHLHGYEYKDDHCFMTCRKVSLPTCTLPIERSFFLPSLYRYSNFFLRE